MYLTRNKINKNRQRALNFFNFNKNLGKKSKIYQVAKKYVRNKKITIDYNTAYKCLNNINLFFNDIDMHWAETDGNTIGLNTFHNFTDSLLIKTFIHEGLHNIILVNGHLLPEKKEHQIMELIDPNLI